jgi:hypothetical protein
MTVIEPTASNRSGEQMTENSTELQPGDELPDETIYAGTLDGRAIYAAPFDSFLEKTFNQAAEFARQMNRETYLGHDDWRVPTKDEMSLLFNNRAAIGEFDASGSYPDGWYWSSSVNDYYAWLQCFRDGRQLWDDKALKASVRTVRG